MKIIIHITVTQVNNRRKRPHQVAEYLHLVFVDNNKRHLLI